MGDHQFSQLISENLELENDGWVCHWAVRWPLLARERVCHLPSCVPKAHLAAQLSSVISGGVGGGPSRAFSPLVCDGGLALRSRRQTKPAKIRNATMAKIPMRRRRVRKTGRRSAGWERDVRIGSSLFIIA